MSVKIGSARIDEHGQAHGGTAGDQTGKEVSTQSWYAHTKGWVLLRAKSAEAREKIARCMQAACDNKHVGYDQYSRESLYNEANLSAFCCFVSHQYHTNAARSPQDLAFLFFIAMGLPRF